MANQRRPVSTGFVGFERPTSNFFRMPNEWTDITAEIRNLAELKVVEYILRHTWGYQEYDVKKHITIDEFVNGRRRQDGSRMDRGTGLSERAVYDGLRLAVERGLIEQEVDDSDRGRTKKFYSLRMRPDSKKGLVPQNPQSGVQGLHPPLQTLQVPPAKSAPRSEKDTRERKDSKIRKASLQIGQGKDGIGGTPQNEGQGAEHWDPRTPEEVMGPTRTRPGSSARFSKSDTQGSGGTTDTGSSWDGAGGARRAGRPRRVPQQDESYQTLQSYMSDFAREFNDQAPLRASTMRAYNLLKRTGLPQEQFIGYLYAARAVTKEHTASIRNRAGEDAFGGPVKAKMAFFFAVLEDLIGVHGPSTTGETDAPITRSAD
jgi:hypothetical protein